MVGGLSAEAAASVHMKRPWLVVIEYCFKTANCGGWKT
jgi:hypothetical protein